MSGHNALHHDINDWVLRSGDCRSTIGDGLVFASSTNRRLVCVTASVAEFRERLHTNEGKYG